MKDFVRDTTGVEVVEELADRVNGKTCEFRALVSPQVIVPDNMVVVITGASDKGLGGEIAFTLAHANPGHLVLTARARTRVDPVIARIKELDPSITTTFVAIELDDFDSVRSAAATINSSVTKIDYLINNAGIMAVEEFKTNKDGIELQFATNHLGHFLLTKLLLSKLLVAGSGSRIVNLTSLAHKICPVRFGDYNFAGGKEYSPWAGYGQAKTANILFSVSLAEKLRSKGIQSYAVHPGAIMTTGLGRYITDPEKSLGSIDSVAFKNTGRHFSLADDIPKPIQQGINTVLMATLDLRIEGDSGSYMANTKIEPAYEYAEDKGNAEKLWELSETLVGEKFSI